jgi:hypothetical protein
VNVTEKSPDPPPLGEYDPFHLPSTVDVETGLPVEENEDDEGAAVDSVPAAGGVVVDVVLEELEQAASSTPHTTIVPQIPTLAARFIPSSLRQIS